MTTLPVPPLSERFERALVLAARWHAAQRKKGSGVPYIAHLLGVASIALEFGASENEAIAALLHDAIEDGPQNLRRLPADLKAELAREFGERVLAIVQGCTDAEPAPGQPKAPWVERKRAYLDHLRGADAPTLLVSAADKLYNARAILLDFLTVGDEVFARFTGRREGTLWYYRSLSDGYAEVLRERPALTAHARLPGLIVELERIVAALEQEAGVTANQARTADLGAIGG